MSRKSKQTWVSPHPDGGWQVKKDNAVKAIKLFRTQKEAIKVANKIADNEQGELVIQASNGKIREKNSHGEVR